jgi:hypothetical protein
MFGLHVVTLLRTVCLQHVRPALSVYFTTHQQRYKSPYHAVVMTKTTSTRSTRKLQKLKLSRNSVIVCISFPPICGSVVCSQRFTVFLSISCLQYITSGLPATRGVPDNLWLCTSIRSTLGQQLGRYLCQPRADQSRLRLKLWVTRSQQTRRGSP